MPSIVNVPRVAPMVLPVRLPSWSNTLTAAIGRPAIAIVALTGSSMIGGLPLSKTRPSNAMTLKPVLQFRATAETSAVRASASVSCLPAAVRNSDA